MEISETIMSVALTAGICICCVLLGWEMRINYEHKRRDEIRRLKSRYRKRPDMTRSEYSGKMFKDSSSYR